MEVNVSGEDKVSDDVQITLNNEKLRQRIETGLGNITLVRDIDIKNIILMRRVAAETLPMANVLFPIEQVDVSNFPSLYDIEVVNSLPLASMNMDEIHSSCIVRIKQSFLEDIVSSDIPVFNKATIELYELKAAFNFAAKYCNKIISHIPVVNSHLRPTASKIVDLSAIKNRNLIELCDKVKDMGLKHSLPEMLRNKYVEGDVAEIPEYARTDIERAKRDSRYNYSKYVFPLMPLERDFLHVALTLFNDQYVHPSVIIDFMTRFETVDFVIDSKVKNSVFEMQPNIRTPRLYLQQVRIGTMYRIPSARNELRAAIRKMMKIMVKFEIIVESIKAFKDVLELNVSTSTALSDFTSYCTNEGAVAILNATHLCNINRNLYRLNVGLIGINSFEKFYSIASILLCQLLFPPDVIEYDIRRLINNGMCKYIMRFKLSAEECRRIRNFCLNTYRINIPAEEGPDDAWVTTNTLDFLPYLYGGCIRMLGAENGTTTMLRRYFNGVIFNDLITRVDGTNGELASTWAPYMYGRITTELDIDQSADVYRGKARMENNGALWISIKNDRGIDAPSFYDNKMMILRELLTEVRQQNTYTSRFTIQKLTQIVEYFSHQGKIRFLKFLEYYTFRLKQYSLSIAADGHYRDVPFYNREEVNINILDGLGILIKVSASIELTDNLRPYYLDGASASMRMTVFIMIYEIVDRINKECDKAYTKNERIQWANEITAIVLGLSTFDAMKQFSDGDSDSADFMHFLETTGINDIHNEYVACLMRMVNSMRMKMRSMHRELGLRRYIYISKDALYYNELRSLDGTCVIASNAIPKSRLIVKRDYQTLNEVYVDMRTEKRVVGKPRFRTNVFDDEFNKLKIPGMEEMRNGSARFEVMRIPLTHIVKIDIIRENGKFEDKSSVNKPKFDAFKKYLESVSSDIHGPKIYNLNQYIVINDAGDATTPYFGMFDQDMYIRSLTGTQVFSEYEEIPLSILTMNNLIERLSSEIVTRKEPFIINPQQNVPFRYVNSGI